MKPRGCGLAGAAARRRRWPGRLAVGARGWRWYAADSLRHRREGAFGYELGQRHRGRLAASFLRAAEALTGAPITRGQRGRAADQRRRDLPGAPGDDPSRRETLNLETYVYWTGDIADEVAGAICERAEAGVECKVLLDALGSAKMDRDR